MIRSRTINGVKVEPIPTDPVDPKRIAGYKLFPEAYGTIFLCAPRRSGKTTTIFEILRQCVGKNTKIYGFVATHSLDNSWIHIKKFLTEKKIDAEWFHAIKEGKHDQLKEIVDRLQAEADLKELEEAQAKQDRKKKEKILFFNPINDQIEIRTKKPKKIYPEVIFIFDDVGDQIKSSPSFTQLMKANRHYKSKLIVSSQYPQDIRPESRQQLSYCLVWPRFNEDKIQELYKFLNPDVDFEDFMRLYKYATAKPYNFLYVDVAGGTFRKNFNEELSVAGMDHDSGEDTDEDSD